MRLLNVIEMQRKYTRNRHFAWFFSFVQRAYAGADKKIKTSTHTHTYSHAQKPSALKTISSRPFTLARFINSRLGSDTRWPENTALFFLSSEIMFIHWKHKSMQFTKSASFAYAFVAVFFKMLYIVRHNMRQLIKYVLCDVCILCMFWRRERGAAKEEN